MLIFFCKIFAGDIMTQTEKPERYTSRPADKRTETEELVYNILEKLNIKFFTVKKNFCIINDKIDFKDRDYINECCKEIRNPL